jgi:hypothetical protein
MKTVFRTEVDAPTDSTRVVVSRRLRFSSMSRPTFASVQCQSNRDLQVRGGFFPERSLSGRWYGFCMQHLRPRRYMPGCPGSDLEPPLLHHAISSAGTLPGVRPCLY